MASTSAGCFQFFFSFPLPHVTVTSYSRRPVTLLCALICGLTFAEGLFVLSYILTACSRSQMWMLGLPSLMLILSSQPMDTTTQPAPFLPLSLVYFQSSSLPVWWQNIYVFCHKSIKELSIKESIKIEWAITFFWGAENLSINKYLLSSSMCQALFPLEVQLIFFFFKSHFFFEICILKLTNLFLFKHHFNGVFRWLFCSPRSQICLEFSTSQETEE